MSALRRRLRPLGQAFALAALLGVSSACGTEPEAPPYAARLEPKSLLNQFGAPGEFIHQPPAVVVKDQYGNPMKGIEVRFEAAVGSVARTLVTTDHTGLAFAGTWTLPPTEGEDMVTATVAGFPQIRFRARVRIPVEIARYDLVSQGGATLPVSYGVSSVIGGSLSFYTDDTFVYRFTQKLGNGQLYSGEIPGLYARNDRAVQSLRGASFDVPFVAEISSTGLMVEYQSMDWSSETYKVVSTAPPWP